MTRLIIARSHIPVGIIGSEHTCRSASSNYGASTGRSRVHPDYLGARIEGEVVALFFEFWFHSSGEGTAQENLSTFSNLDAPAKTAGALKPHIVLSPALFQSDAVRAIFPN